MSDIKCVIYWLQDKSYSMSSMGSIPGKAIKRFIADRQQDLLIQKKYDIYVDVSVFNDKNETIFKGPVNDYNVSDAELKYKITPCGLTNICENSLIKLSEMKHEMNILDNQGHHVFGIFVLFTDGEDNAGFINTDTMKNLILSQRNIVPIFAACNQDAVKNGEKFGFESRNCLSIKNSKQNVDTAFSHLSDYIRRIILQGDIGGFTEDEKLSALFSGTIMI